MLNDSDAVNRSTANGVTTIFPYTFKIFDKTQIDVYSNTTALTVDVDFTVDGIGQDAGGNVTISSAPANGVIITILRKQPTTQTSHYQSETFPPSRIETDFDKLAMRLQQIKETLRRCLSFAKSSSTVDQTIDTPTDGLFARAKTGGGIDWATPAAVNASLPLSIANGGTGATSAAAAQAALFTIPLTISNGGTGSATAGGARTALGVSATEPADNVFHIVGSSDATKKAGFEVDGLTASTTRTLTVQDTDGTLAVLGNNQLNPVINGNMELWQRGTSLSVTGGDVKYVADRFVIEFNTTSAVATVSRSTNVPTVGQAGILFNYSYDVDITTADAVIAAGDAAVITQKIEGYNWRQLAQRACTLSFWVRSTKTGIHSVNLSNSVGDRGYTAEYTIAVSDTWQFVSIAIPASPAAGTWDYLNGKGLHINWLLACGSNWQASQLNAWHVPAGTYEGSANQVNCLDSTANFFRFTGVKLELGSVATALAYIPFETELARCQRYYQKSFAIGVTPAQNTGDLNGCLIWPALQAGATAQRSPVLPLFTRMRAAPSRVSYSPAAATAQAYNVTRSEVLTSISFSGSGDSGVYVSATGSASTAIADLLAVHWTADAEL